VVVFIFFAFLIPIQFSELATFSIVFLTVLLIASLRPGTAAHRILTSPPIVYVGVISYSLYLWHWSVLSIGRWTIGIHWWSAPIQAGLMFMLAIGSYRYIENPLRRANWSDKRFKTIACGLSASAVAAALLVTLDKSMAGHL
jgi:peptidoglycan/LPS O-acetylase OafA/YrhL